MALNASPSGAAAGVHVRTDERVATVTLNHPGRLNALTVVMWHQLRDIFLSLDEDAGLRAVILRGADGNFAAGADIREFPAARADRAGVMRYHREVIAPALNCVAACRHPVIAGIEGVCVGGGLEIASQCDLRVAAASSRYGVPINRLGFPMAPDEMQGLIALAGRAATLEILLEGRIFGAHEALAKGLLTRVVPDAELDEDLARTARRIARGAPLAARLNKRLARRLDAGAPPLSEDEMMDFFSYAETRDHREGVRAFLAGEEPDFTGE